MSLPAPEGDASQHHVHYEQRRIGHICAILVRNLSLRPTRDRALQTINSKRPGASSRYHTTSDDADLTLSLARSNSKGKAKGKASGPHGRRRRASWDIHNSGSSDDDHDDERVNSFPSTSKSPLRNKLERSTSYGRPDNRGRSAFLSNHRRTSDYDLSSSSLHAPSTDGAHSSDASPRPILKRSSSTRDGRDARVSSSPSPSFLDELGANTTMLSRSDSRSSSHSSHTIRRPPHRSRTTSMTSSHSVRSVRFDESHMGGSPEEKRQSRMTGRLNAASRYALFSQKSLKQIMKDRMLECFVELSAPSIDEESSKPESTFYRTPNSKPGLHHSWGYQGGDPITPERDFTIDSEQATPLQMSTVRIKAWARSPTPPESKDSAAKSTGQTEAEWKLVCHTSVDLRDLTPVAGNLQDASMSLPPNSILLGLAPGANSLSGRADLVNSSDSTSALSNGDRKSDPKLARKASEREAERTRHVLESIIYYTVPINSVAAGISDGTNGVPKPSVNASKPSKKQAGRDGSLSRSPTPRRRASVEGYASDPENAPTRKPAPTSPSGKLPSSTSSPSNPTQPLPSDTRRQRRKAFEDEQRRAIELSLRETKMMPSYDLKQAKLLARKQSELQNLMVEVEELRQRDGSALQDPNGLVQLRLKREQQMTKSEAVRKMAIDESDDLQRRRAELQERKAALERRRDAMHATRRLFQAAKDTCGRLREEVDGLKSDRRNLSLQVHTQQASLLRDLEMIFPIELCDASSLLFSICGLPLPNAVASLPQPELAHEEKKWKELVKTHYPSAARPIFHAFDDDTVSSAFGLVAQLVVLLSTYLATPIHYPLATAGSRAVVQDGISLMSGPRAFPLYAKGMERYRYEYAAYLLNKDVEQLMNVHSVTVIDIRHTLPNLKNLMVTVAAAPPQSQVTRKSHIGKNEIALRSVKSAASLAAPRAEEERGDEEARGGAKAGLGLGLGLPQVNGEAGKQYTLVTTRVLGAPSKAAPTTATATSGAIASVSRAFSYFSGSSTR